MIIWPSHFVCRHHKIAILQFWNNHIYYNLSRDEKNLHGYLCVFHVEALTALL